MDCRAHGDPPTISEQQMREPQEDSVQLHDDSMQLRNALCKLQEQYYILAQQVKKFEEWAEKLL
jgi:hypothetical protein